MPPAIIGFGSGTGTVTAFSETEVAFSGIYTTENGTVEYGHEQLLQGVEFELEEGMFATFVVTAIFQESGQAFCKCVIGREHSVDAASVEIDDDEPIIREMRFDIFT